MDERTEQIVEYVLDNGEVSKDEVLNAFGVAEAEHPNIKRGILKHPLIEAGPSRNRFQSL
jgi:hypothetical protein